MTNTIKRSQVFIFYALLIIVLAIIGDFIGSGPKKSVIFAAIGAFIGILISYFLWYNWGQFLNS